MLKIKNGFLLFILACLAFSCQEEAPSDVSEKNAEQIQQESVSDEEKTHQVTFDAIINELPGPLEVCVILSETNHPYQKEMMNGTDISKYNTQFQKAINLGIYGVDLNYAAVYKNTEDIMDYLYTVQNLTEEIDIADIFNSDLMISIQNNLSNSDSLVSLSYPVYKNIHKFLHEHHQENTSICILTGGILEGLYIASNIIKGEPKDSTNALIYQKINDLTESLDHTMDFMNTYEKTDEMRHLLGNLEAVQAIYAKEQGDLSEETIKSLAVETNKVRQELI